MTADDIQPEGRLGCEMEREVMCCAPSAQTEPRGGRYLGRQHNRDQVHETGRLLNGSRPDKVSQGPPKAVMLISEVIFVGRIAGVAA